MSVKKNVKISDSDLVKLYEYAEAIAKIGKKYGMTGITQVFINALNQLNSKNSRLETGQKSS